MMNNNQSDFYSAFYRDCYLQSGWLPAFPFGSNLQNGDVVQIRRGQILPLLNIQQLNLTHPERYSEAVTLSESEWPKSFACLQTHNDCYSEQSEEGIRQICEQYYAFQQAGAYLFRNKNPEGRFLLNWHQIAEELIVKLTQSKFSFQEVYVITDVVNIPHWGLAIAAQADAELRLIAETTSSDCLLESENCQMNTSRYLAIYEHRINHPLCFFRAKKLVLTAKKYDELLGEILSNNGVMDSSYHKGWMQTNLLNLGNSATLNISTCMDFFDWQEVGMDEVVKLVGY